MASLTPDFDGRLDRLKQHPLYKAIKTEDHLRIFLKHHVYCVWDFQSLLRSIQQGLVGTQIPWLPNNDPAARRLINEIVLTEESDVHPHGGYASHFEIYLESMHEANADRDGIVSLVEGLKHGEKLQSLLRLEQIPADGRHFMETTFSIIEKGSMHCIVAAFVWGREEIVPRMFLELVKSLSQSFPQRWGLFSYYLSRHLEVDGERHGPIAMNLLENLLGNNEKMWQEAVDVTNQVLDARLQLWDAILAEIEGKELSH